MAENTPPDQDAAPQQKPASNTSSNDSFYTQNRRYSHCIHLNSQSLRSKDKFNTLIAEINGYDAVAISETWFKTKNTEDSTYIPGYHNAIRKDRSDDKEGGGVALYIRDSYGTKHRRDLDVPGLEAVWAEIRLRNRTVLICAMYREPRSKIETWDLIETSIEQAKLTGIQTLFILGDLNEDMMKPNNKLKMNTIYPK